MKRIAAGSVVNPIALLIFLCAVLSGCTSFSVVKKAIAEDGSKAADEALQAVVFYQCNAATVGAVKRRFQTQEDIDAYNTMCGDTLPIEGTEPED